MQRIRNLLVLIVMAILIAMSSIAFATKKASPNATTLTAAAKLSMALAMPMYTVSLAALAFPPPPGGDNWFYTPNSGYYDSTPPAAPSINYCLEMFGNQACYTETDLGGIGGWNTECMVYTIGFKRPSLSNNDYSKSALLAKSLINGSNKTPYSAGQTGSRRVEGKIEPTQYQFLVRVWIPNDINWPAGTIRTLNLFRVKARQDTASVVMSQANAYPLPPIRGTAYDPIAFEPPNSSNDVRDTLDVLTDNPYGVGVMIPWIRSSSSGPMSQYASYPTNGDLEYYDAGLHVPTDTVLVMKDSDGWYRLWAYPQHTALDIMVDDPQQIRLLTITNLGDTGPYQHVGTANTMSLRQIRIYDWDVHF